jgi:hypothetical protein
MKKLFIILFIVTSCTKEKQEKKPVLVNDSFGKTSFNLTKRIRDNRLTGTQTSLIDKEKKPIPTDETGVKNIILLSFNGATISNTNFNYTGDIICENSGLTIAQQQFLLDSVQKDFKYQYNKITFDENLYNQSRTDRRIKIIITQTYAPFEEYGVRAGGRAYVGSFTWGDNTPCLVHSSLLSYDLRIIRVAISHEAGHSYGLQHTLEADGEIMNGQGSAYYAAWVYWGTAHDEWGNNQYDGRNMEAINGGKYDGQGHFLPYGTYK